MFSRHMRILSVICQSEIEVHVSGENALDFGGVTRDVFCSFWDQLINNS